jgi:hypothetical protein
VSSLTRRGRGVCFENVAVSAEVSPENVALALADAAGLILPTHVPGARHYNVTGRAPNSIELHPILDFACFS